jgi:acetoin utilization deacetylase AcuC-like enzyme
MTTLLYHHPVFAEHDTGYGHPESPARLQTILKALEDPELAELRWREAPPASVEQITLIHSQEHFDRVMAAIPRQDLRLLDGDTVVSPRSGEAALRAAGAVCAAVDAVVTGDADNAFCAVRPPGHHAEPNTAMGFCLFNNAAIGAAHARKAHGLERVAVIDFDVHHGNGTQVAFETQPPYFYVSTHQSPLYPGTGRHSERGMGNILNLPLAPNSGTAELQEAWTDHIELALRHFRPDLIIISAGFDAHCLDPLAELNFTEDDYRWITRRILELAAELAGGRVVSTLEGGYNLSALAKCTTIHVKELMEAAPVSR